MFSSNTKKIKFLPADGMKVLVTGKISVFEANGAYQIYVNDMLEDGVGNLYIAYEQLKQKLEQEGLFKKEYKKNIPKIPNRVGVITAPTGAAIKDIISTIKRRWPLAQVILFPSLVQGDEAKEDIVRQIENAKQYHLDTLIVGRGGGSIEDLWPFNEEIVARSIFDCEIPVISAVGHEIDFTISDFVADLRAPTPTGAAELAVPQKVDVENYLCQLKIRLNKAMQHKININSQKLEEIKNRYIFQNPVAIYQAKELQFDTIFERLKFVSKNLISLKEKKFITLMSSYVFQNPEKLIDIKKNKYLQLISKLETLSPLLTIQRGYTITKKEKKVITSSNDLKQDDKIELVFADGNVNARVL